MLKQLLILFFILVNYSSNSAFAQDSTKTKLTKWGIGVHVNTVEQATQYEKALLQEYVYSSSKYEWQNKSFSFGIIGTYLLNESAFFRCNVGISKINLLETFDSRTNMNIPGPGYFLGNQSITQSRYYIEPRIGWEMKKAKFGVYGGFALPYTYSKEYKNDGTEIHYDETNTIDYSYNSRIIAPGGFSIGVGAMGGFNFYFLRHFAIGAEISSAYSYYEQGGTITTTIENQFPSSPNTSSSYLYTVKGFEYSGEKLSFNLAYFF